MEKELRVKNGSTILEYISRFSATEKVIFGTFIIVATVMVIIMVRASALPFMAQVPTSGGTVREGVIGLPRTVNPVLAVTDVDKDIASLTYSGLLKYQNGKLVPDIADSYSVSDDGLTYDFKLKPNVYFHDGIRLTADDIAFTVEKIQDANLKSPRRADWANISVKKISDDEIQFILKKPYSPFMSNTTVGILPKHIWGSVSDEQFIFSQYNLDPIGTGPYRVSSISRDSGGIPVQYILNVWKDYYAKKPYISSFVFSFFADEDKMLSALNAGTIDSAAAISPTAASRLEANTAEAYRIIHAPLPRVFGLFFNQNQATVLSDADIRKALNMTIDRNEIVSKIMYGYGTPINGPLPPSLSTDDIVASSTNNLDAIAAAQAILAKDGWKINDAGILEKKNGKSASTTMSFSIYTADSPDLKETAELIKAYWRALGADVTIKVFESGDLYQNVIKPRKFDVLLFGEQIGKDGDLYAFWHSSQRNSPGLNVSMYVNSKIDDLLEDLRSSSDPVSREKDYNSLDSIIKSDLPAVFLYSPDFIYAIPKTLNGVDLGYITTTQDRWNSVGDWYIDTETVWKIFDRN
ncbi:MAG: ABC transporter substrate-binding protein [Patescibacteria group bacterium]|nr:ABC transporter substrate-binding protein [Patescibacteria group bacterium]